LSNTAYYGDDVESCKRAYAEVRRLYSSNCLEEVFLETKIQIDKKRGPEGEIEGANGEKGLRPLMQHSSSIGPNRGESVARERSSIHPAA
jgi:hypothetical protein